MDIDSSDSEGYEEDLQAIYEDEKGDFNVICLFCPEKAVSPEATFVHMKQEHAFDIVNFWKKKSLDHYSYLKFINFIRKCPTDSKLADNLDVASFEDESFLLPVLADDPLLQIDIEEDLAPEWAVLTECHTSDEKESMDSKFCESSELKKLRTRLKAFEVRAKYAEENLYRAIQDMNHCKVEVGRSLLSTAAQQEHSAGVHGDNNYFESYSHFGIHEEMLKDKVRTEAYLSFIRGNEHLFIDKCVLDIGCGTGILSMFAARAGAKEVVAVDQSDIAYTAMDIVRENGLEDRVHVIRDRAENLTQRIGDKKFDIIISEWMGYFLLFENMLGTVLFCRDNFLLPTGCVYPNRLSLYLVAIMDRNFYKQRVKFWDDVYGFKMTCLKNRVKEDAIVDLVDADDVISEPTEISRIDMMTGKATAQEFETDFNMIFTKEGYCTALVGYFDTSFDQACNLPVYFSTGPESLPTHWKQTIFLLDSEIPVQAGEKICGRICCKKLEKDHRSLQIELSISNGSSSQKKKYFIC